MNKNPKIKQQDHYVQSVYEQRRVNNFLEDFESKKTQDAFKSALVRFNRYVESKHNSTCHDIVDLVTNGKVDVYDLVKGFIKYLPGAKEGITPRTIREYVHTVKNYLETFDIETSERKWRKNVVRVLPDIVKEKERAVTKEEFERLLISSYCGKRLKAFLLMLLTTGARANELCCIRNCDVNWNTELTTIKLRGEYTKTKATRYVFLTPEATRFLKEFIHSRRPTNPQQLLFTIYEHKIPKNKEETQAMSKTMYISLNREFIKLLEMVELDQKKETGVSDNRRHEIVLHSCRHYFKTAKSSCNRFLLSLC